MSELKEKCIQALSSTLKPSGKPLFSEVEIQTITLRFFTEEGLLTKREIAKRRGVSGECVRGTLERVAHKVCCYSETFEAFERYAYSLEDFKKQKAFYSWLYYDR